MRIARANAAEAGSKANFIQGNASAIPFPEADFDFVFCSWSFKNFKAPTEVLNEVCRVLKPDGKALIVDLNRDATSNDWNRYASDRGLKGMTALFMRLAFMIQRSGAYSVNHFEKLLADTVFGKCDIERQGINLSIALTK